MNVIPIITKRCTPLDNNQRGKIYHLSIRDHVIDRQKKEGLLISLSKKRVCRPPKLLEYKPV